MIFSKKACSHDRVIVALKAEIDEYLHYETSGSGDTIGNICVLCHDGESSNFFGIQKKINITDGGYARLSFPEMMKLKENTNIKIIVDDEGKLLAYATGKTLRVISPVACSWVLVFNRSSKEERSNPLAMSKNISYLRAKTANHLKIICQQTMKLKVNEKGHWQIISSKDIKTDR